MWHTGLIPFAQAVGKKARNVKLVSFPLSAAIDGDDNRTKKMVSKLINGGQDPNIMMVISYMRLLIYSADEKQRSSTLQTHISYTLSFNVSYGQKNTNNVRKK